MAFRVLWSVAWSLATLPLFGWALPTGDGAFQPTAAGRVACCAPR